MYTTAKWDIPKLKPAGQFTLPGADTAATSALVSLKTFLIFPSSILDPFSSMTSSPLTFLPTSFPAWVSYEFPIPWAGDSERFVNTITNIPAMNAEKMAIFLNMDFTSLLIVWTAAPCMKQLVHLCEESSHRHDAPNAYRHGTEKIHVFN